MRVAIFIGEADEHRQLLFALARTLAAAGLRGVLQIAALIAVEVDVDRIDRYHRGQHGLAGGHVIAGGDLGARDTAVDRCGDAREAEIELRGFNVGARRSEEHTSEPQSLMRISYAVFCLKTTKNTL